MVKFTFLLSFVTISGMATEITHPTCKTNLVGGSEYGLARIATVLNNKGYTVLSNHHPDEDVLWLSENRLRGDSAVNDTIEIHRFSFKLEHRAGESSRPLVLLEETFYCAEDTAEERNSVNAARCRNQYYRVADLLVNTLPNCVIKPN